MKLSALAIVSAATLASISSIASAVVSFGSASPTKSNASTDFIAGNGISELGFTIDTNPLSGESVALKARNRAIPGEPILQVANRYFVAQGMDTPTRAAWNFDFQFSPGLSTALPSAYTYVVEADINPAFGTATFTTTNVPSSVVVAPMGDSYFPNGTGGTITAGPTYSYNGGWTNTTPFVIANSQNYNFAHLAGAGFTNAGPAEYEIRFSALDASGAVVASTTIFAEVVPEPTTLTVLGAAGVLGLRRRRA